MSLRSPPSGTRLFGLGALLAGAMAASNLMQFALGALAPVLAADLDLSRSLLGALITTYYAVAAGLSLLVGRWIGRVGGRRAVAGLLLVAASAYVATAAAPTYGFLLAGVGLAGLATAMSNPITNAVLAGREHGDSHGVLVGVKQAGVQIGAFVAGVALPPLALAAGWRAAMLGCAAVGLALLPLAAAVPADTHAGERGTAAGHRDGDRGGDSPASPVRYLVGYAFLMGAGMATVTAYLALYAHEAMGLGQQTAGLLLAVIGAGGVVARIAWAGLAGRLRGGWRAGLLAMAVAAMAGTALFVAAGSAGAWALWVGAVVLGCSGAAWTAVAMLAVIRTVPAQRVARDSGRVLAGFYVGLCLTPPAFGVIVDVTGDYRPAWMLTAIAFAGATGLSSLATRRRPPAPDDGAG